MYNHLKWFAAYGNYDFHPHQLYEHSWIPDTHNIPGGIPLCDLFSISDYMILPIE